ncbi:MAG: hypothetical protein RQ745_12880, partial [Longimicrobiales bacterium]|nr:hypothetical protein [Longimicrobiales bacterium]
TMAILNDVVDELVEVDDDLGGPYPPPARDAFRETLAPEGDDTPGSTLVVAVWAETRGWKGRAGLSEASRAALADALADAGVPSHVVVFGGERVVADIPEGPTVWLAWGGESLMQRAAALRLRGRSA